MATPISLATIVELRVPVMWPEAVAVAQEVARKASSGGSAGLDNCVLSLSGAVEVVGKSRRPFVSEPAAETLRALLDPTQAPRELVSLLESHKSEATGGFGDLGNELNFFARPDPTGAIAALAVRAVEAESEAAQRAEFERLRTHTAVPTAATEKEKRATGRLGGWWALAAATLAILGVVAVLAVGAGRAGTASASTRDEEVPLATADASPVKQAADRLDSLVDKGLERLGLRPTEPSAAVPQPAAAPVAPKASRRSAALRSPLAPATTPLFVLMPPTVDPSKDVGEVVIGRAAEPSGPSGEAAPVDETPLQPPVLRWPQLPDEPGSVPVDMREPYLELLINQQGTVEKVRLHSPRNSYHDRMLVSAAKAWVFHPAQKDGRAVRYLMKVPIIRQ